MAGTWLWLRHASLHISISRTFSACTSVAPGMEHVLYRSVLGMFYDCKVGFWQIRRNFPSRRLGNSMSYVLEDQTHILGNLRSTRGHNQICTHICTPYQEKKKTNIRKIQEQPRTLWPNGPIFCLCRRFHSDVTLSPGEIEHWPTDVPNSSHQGK